MTSSVPESMPCNAPPCRTNFVCHVSGKCRAESKAEHSVDGKITSDRQLVALASMIERQVPA
jgi:hypothetical protein